MSTATNKSSTPQPMIFDRRPWTDWIIEVLDERPNPNECEGFYSRTRREGLECEEFTLNPKEDDFALFQVRLFDDGMVTSTTFAPAFVRVDPIEKRVIITLIPEDANIPPRIRRMPCFPAT